MPIYDYRCQDCDHEFERLVLKKTSTVTCPECESDNLERLISLPRVHSEATHGLAMRAARKRDKKLGRERVEEQRLYEQSHND